MPTMFPIELVYIITTMFFLVGFALALGISQINKRK